MLPPSFNDNRIPPLSTSLEKREAWRSTLVKLGILLNYWIAEILIDRKKPLRVDECFTNIFRSCAYYTLAKVADILNCPTTVPYSLLEKAMA